MNFRTLLQVVRKRCAVAMLMLPAIGWSQSPSPLPLPDLDIKGYGKVLAIARQPDGGVLIGGEFSSINGFPRRNLARLQPDGSLDPVWQTATDGVVHALAVDSANGNIFLAGEFQHIDEQPRAFVAKLSAAGAVDPLWHPGANDTVYALAHLGADQLFVGGRFTEIGGVARSRIAKLAASGAGAVDTIWNPSASGTVFALAGDATGAMYAGGDFLTIGGESRPLVAKLSTQAAGPVDLAWNAGMFGLVVYTIVPDDLGQVYLGGSFQSVGAHNRSNLARVSATDGAADANWDPNADNWVRALVLDAANNSVFVAGWFNQIGGQARNVVAKVSQSGSGQVDPDWQPVSDSFSADALLLHNGQLLVGGALVKVGNVQRLGFAALDPNTGAPGPAIDVERAGTVYAIANLSDGGLAVGGRFQKVMGQPRPNLLRLNPDLTLDAAWNPAPNHVVYDLATDAAGNLYAGGAFSAVAGLTRNRVVKLSAAGVVDPLWHPDVTGVLVATLLIDGSNLYIGGRFTHVGGLSRTSIARVSSLATAAVDPIWAPNPNSSLSALALSPDGDIFVGGLFTQIGGLPRARIAKLQSNGVGAADPDWNPGADGFVGELLSDGVGALYAAGGFNQIGGQPRSHLARLTMTGTGSVDLDWNPAANQGVSTLACAGDAIFVGGSFSQIGGAARNRLAKLNLIDGNVDKNWNPDADAIVNAIAHTPGGAVIVGGDFTQIGTQTRVGLAALHGSDVLFGNGFE